MRIDVDLTEESHATAFGDGLGIMALACTSTGCLLAACSPGERGTPAEDIGVGIADELLEDITAGGCVDRW